MLEKQRSAHGQGPTLIGDGATALKHIRAIGNDMALDPGMGNCGRPGKTWMYDAIFVREFVKKVCEIKGWNLRHAWAQCHVV